MARIEVKSEVAGRVWKIEAEAGATLATDDPILIIESMKMEIPVGAPKACKLVEVRVKEEEPVAEGQVVAVVEA
ncbi:MAG TPA: acetyl-CoA carboxylase biotin carboxyl carrier protein subunit [Quisquiliibacterium sp.]|jgi:acetyl-CoA carboxylase biotin carboxyl carrier protein|nr:acetyl-CoA carboxylase biotin carboxyl carrier protein subunit [Quisquiliibacterium sp.]